MKTKAPMMPPLDKPPVYALYSCNGMEENDAQTQPISQVTRVNPDDMPRGKGSESARRALALLGTPNVVDPILVRPQDEKSDYHASTKGVDTFLTPKLPGRFSPWEIKKLSVADRQARFLQAYAASMGNRGLARYYAHWSPPEFRAEVEKYPNFAQAIEDAEEEIADRAKLVLYSDLGLIEHIEVPVATRRVASAVLARLVEGLHARQEQLPITGPRKAQQPRRVRFKQ